MASHARRIVFATTVLVAIWAVTALQPGWAQVHPAGSAGVSRAACSNAEAEKALRESGFAARAERYWGDRFGTAEFAAWRTTCGHLAGRGKDMVTVLLLESGTGGSPKPWAIFNRTRSGDLRLRHSDLGKRLICPQSVNIQNRTLAIYRPTEYLGAYTICDQILRFHWQDGDYRKIGVRPAFERCQNPQVIRPARGYGLIVRDLHVAGVSCGQAARLLSHGLPSKWQCIATDDGTRCLYRGNWRKWMTYIVEGSAS